MMAAIPHIYMKNIGSTFKTKLNIVQFICRNFSNGMKKSPPGKIIDIGSHKIHYQLLGHGKHNVFLLPAIIGSARFSWGPQLDTLNRDKFTILTYDAPAFGFSSPPEYSQHLDGFYRNAEVAAKLMKALGFTKISLVGWCSSSVHAMILAQQNPQIVDKMIYMTPIYQARVEQLELWESPSTVNNTHPKMINELKEYGIELALNKWNNWMKTYRQLEKIDDGYFCRKEMESIKCPTLIIGSKSDNFVFPENGRQLSKIIKHSKYVEFAYDDAKHYPHMIYTQEFNKIVEDFLLE